MIIESSQFALMGWHMNMWVTVTALEMANNIPFSVHNPIFQLFEYDLTRSSMQHTEILIMVTDQIQKTTNTKLIRAFCSSASTLT
jgi:hypothetical protein